MYKTRKTVIVGAGHVGSHVALALIQAGEANDIVLIDIDKDKAVGQAYDLDDAVTSTGAVESGRRSPLQYGHALDIVGIEACDSRAEERRSVP